MKLKFGFYAMIMALCAVTFAACNSDEPGGNTDPGSTDEICPVLTNGKKWICKYMWTYLKTDGIDILISTVDGETSVRGENAKVIKHYNSQGEHVGTSRQREEDGIVMEEWPINSQYGFLYAYEVNPQGGKQFPDHMSEFKIISKGTIVLMGKTRRAALVKDTRYSSWDHYVYDLWVEGIGPLFGSKGFYVQVLPTMPRYCYRPMYVKMLECYDGDEKIYDHSEFSPERYKPEVVFHEPDADAYEILAKMADGSLVTEWNDKHKLLYPI